MSSYFDIMFAKIAVRNGLLSHEQAQACMDDQRRAAEVGYEESLPAVALKRGYLTNEQIRTLERAQAIAQFIRAERTFARQIVKSEMLPQAQVRELFQASQDQGFQKPLSRTLVEQGLLTEDQVQVLTDLQVQVLTAEASQRVVSFVSDASAQADQASEMASAAAATSDQDDTAGSGKQGLGRTTELPTQLSDSDLRGAQKTRSMEIPDHLQVSTRDQEDESEEVSLEPSGSVRLLFGERLVESRVINQDQLDECLALQDDMRKRGEGQRLGEILQEKRYLTETGKNRVVTAMVGADLASSEAPAAGSDGDQRASGERRSRRRRRRVAIDGYDLVARVGQGSLGVVYKARRHGDGEPVAIKILPPSFASSPKLIARFRQAWARARSVDHPNIIHLLDFGFSKDFAWYSMEYVEGASLESRVRDQGPLPEQDAIEAARQLAHALQHAERHCITHRDLSPENVIVTPDERYRIGDVGLSQILLGLSATSVARAGTDPGADRYASPEELRDGAIDARSHVYSLGLVLYYSVMGKEPFAKLEASQWREGVGSGAEISLDVEGLEKVSPRFGGVIKRAVAWDPGQRHANASAFLEDLAQVDDTTRRLLDFQRQVQAKVQSGTLPTVGVGATASLAPTARLDPEQVAAVKAEISGLSSGPGLAPSSDAHEAFDATVVEGSERADLAAVVASRSGSQPARSSADGDSAAAATQPHQLAGMELEGRWQVGTRLFACAFGVVYRGEQLPGGQPVTITALVPSLTDMELSLDQFRDLMLSAARFRHRGLIPVLDVGVLPNGPVFVVSDLVVGRPLDELRLSQTRLSVGRSVAIVPSVLEVLSEPHAQGIAHGGVTPFGVLVDASADAGDLVEVIDFGLAVCLRRVPRVPPQNVDAVATTAVGAPYQDEVVTHLVDPPGEVSGEAETLLVAGPGGGEAAPRPARRLYRTPEGRCYGPPAYLAPEQCAGDPPSPASDVYACGVLLFELLAGSLPVVASDPADYLGLKLLEPPRSLAEVAPDLGLGEKLLAVCSRALSKDRQQRFASAAEMLVALAATQSTMATDIDHASSAPRPAAKAAPVALVPGRPTAAAAPAEAVVAEDPEAARPPPQPSREKRGDLGSTVPWKVADVQKHLEEAGLDSLRAASGRRRRLAAAVAVLLMLAAVVTALVLLKPWETGT